MSLMGLNNLYREVILDHSEHPHHKRRLANATQTITLKNPTCGDVINLEIELDNNRIKDIGFTGEGCTISQSSSSMMTDAVLGKSVVESLEMAQIFSDMVMGQKHPQADLDKLGDAAILSSVMKFPARIKCATLCWWALRKSLGDEER
ncbi:iron-sulfur cluster assembly scaffold protein [Companilactobacillus crustorum]|uniref:NifU-like protein n=3 Tax=Companilactobacillus TaxID=2767879 RepID=A0A837RHN9_9LACO|nr:SUF system NifU family Fe-S cluster assembly protein [Companilactobacillus crustorum]HCD08141.1 SUF system NifU family Fe-S cluster assembly protein [Lactobacillus sp.]KRK42848.1 NifU-like protein [Companilactobacillus crustorum JCM 15951]KRO20538.1 NifU-like protein [Companilactobacillus crustorum]WDT65373.1 SUF system NifU family Fe-S cluster assembly protein [Companilactobacillus crustorum]GEO76767.1 iron-sulfur cluster assembly scaffold protein [Companilactobacillus crustorum]